MKLQLLAAAAAAALLTLLTPSAADGRGGNAPVETTNSFYW